MAPTTSPDVPDPDEGRNLPTRYVSHADLDLMFRVAKAYALSKFYEDADSEMKAFVIVSAGRELGLQPFQSFQYIDVIKGKPFLNAQFFAKLIREHDHYDYHVVEITNERCIIQILRDGEIIGTSEFDQEDAKLAELDRPGRSGSTSMYVKYPRNMLFARALSNGAAFFAPDVLGFRPYLEGEDESEYLAIKEARAERAAALARGESAPALDPVPAGPVEEVRDVEPEPDPDQPGAPTAEEAALEDAPEPAATEEKPKRRTRATAKKDESAAPANKPTAGTSQEIQTPPAERTAAQILAEQDQNIAKVRALIISGLTGKARDDCHESLKFLGWWGPDAPKKLWINYGKAALDWSTLEPKLNDDLKAELDRQAAEEEARAADPVPEPEPGEPPFGEAEEPAEQILEPAPEDKPPWDEPEPEGGAA